MTKVFDPPTQELKVWAAEWVEANKLSLARTLNMPEMAAVLALPSQLLIEYPFKLGYESPAAYKSARLLEFGSSVVPSFGFIAKAHEFMMKIFPKYQAAASLYTLFN